jgi:hypothetical protein
MLMFYARAGLLLNVTESVKTSYTTPNALSSRAKSLSAEISHFTNSAVLSITRTVMYGSKTWPYFEGKTRITNEVLRKISYL